MPEDENSMSPTDFSHDKTIHQISQHKGIDSFEYAMQLPTRAGGNLPGGGHKLSPKTRDQREQKSVSGKFATSREVSFSD